MNNQSQSSMVSSPPTRQNSRVNGDNNLNSFQGRQVDDQLFGTILWTMVDIRFTSSATLFSARLFSARLFSATVQRLSAVKQGMRNNLKYRSSKWLGERIPWHVQHSFGQTLEAPCLTIVSEGTVLRLISSPRTKPVTILWGS